MRFFAFIWLAVFAVALTPVQDAQAQIFLEDRAYGDPNAPVTVIEYASLGCPHCKTFHEQVWPEFKTTYVDTGQVYFIFREFPFHLPDLRAVTLARCGGEARYGAFIDSIFANQSDWMNGGDPMPALNAIARQGGISQEAYDACLADEGLQQSILDRRNLAIEAGVQSTPTFDVNGTLHGGVQQMSNWADILGDGAGAAGGDDMTMYLIIGGGVVVLAGGAFFMMRRRSA